MCCAQHARDVANHARVQTPHLQRERTVHRYIPFPPMLLATLILVAGEIVLGQSASPEHLEMRDDSLWLRQGELCVPVSLECLTFVTDRGTLGIRVKPTQVIGQITRERPIQATYPPLPLAYSGRLVVSPFLQWSAREHVLRKIDDERTRPCNHAGHHVLYNARPSAS